ncbi:bromodomain-containing protein 4B [Achroia grisella]|uniref:bromodomain-containing protein 4B n=1 Tax=Achroia grisella TaxID=688607 RepID=UPI0027D3439C|nr:bromodomain-containing protein 4B [Achroia grisella]
MRLTFWVTALAVLSLTHAKNSTAKAKPKRQLESIRTPQNLQYSLVLPHSRVTHFRSLTSSRRISHIPSKGGKLPPYAVQMEPVVQYSQKDPLYDPNLENLEDAGVNKNEIYAQPKILNVHDSSDSTYSPSYGALPTAPLYSQDAHPHYYESPEPIIEIIIKESNESLPAPPPQIIPKKKKEPVQVFYVKYSKDPYSKDKVVYEKPIPAITPPTNDEDEHHEEYVTVTPQPAYGPIQTTTLRAIIKPESEVYHSDSSVKITFGNEGRHYSDRRESNTESHEATAPRPAIAFPNQPPSHIPLERSVSPKPQPHHEASTRGFSNSQAYKPVSQHAQSRIQFQPQYLTNEQQLPRQGPSLSPFRVQSNINRQNSFGPTPPFSPSPSPHTAFANSPGPIPHFSNIAPTVASPIGPAFSTSFPRPNNNPSFHVRPSPPSFNSRPHFNGPPRPAFHSGPQRPFQQPHTQSRPFFDEPKYLQENYHTITSDQVDPPKEQLLPNRQSQNFNFIQPSPSPTPAQFQEHSSRPQIIPQSQQLPQQRPPQHFVDIHNKPSFSISPSRPPFFNLKPSPPQIEDNRPPFQQFKPQQQQPQPQQFSFHQGAQILSQPTSGNSVHHQHTFSSPSPSPIPQNQFLPQPSASPTLFNFHPQPSPSPEQHHFHQQNSPSERPQIPQSHGPSERPFLPQQNNFQPQANLQHQQNIQQFVPNGGELVASIPKYEQHITVNSPNTQPNYSALSESVKPTPTASPTEQYQQQQQQQQQQLYESEQEQVRLQLAENVKKQQEEIQRLQTQLLLAQQQQQQQQHQHLQQQHLQQNQQLQQQEQQQSKQYEQTYKVQNNYNQQPIQVTSPKSQYVQERSREQSNYVSSTQAPAYYQSTSRTVEIKPTTQKYLSSTRNSISTTPEPKKEEKKKKPQIVLPDEVPDDLRQQLLSSGILDNADISVLDYDKVGETPLESLPPDQLANFFSAGGAQQIAASEHRPIVVKPNGEQIESRIDDDVDDQEIAASENVATYALPPPSKKQAVEMKVVHFDPKTAEGQNIAKEYVKEDATRLDPVALNDKKYNRYLPLKVSGNQFPLPDILKGRKITSVVVLAPVETEDLGGDHTRSERAASNGLRGIKFVAGDSLQDLLKRPTKDNFEKWLEVEKRTNTDQQSVILLVTGNDKTSGDREIFMYDISSGNVNKLNGDLSSAFVDAAENNSISKDIEKLAIEGDGTPEEFGKGDDEVADGSENVPLLVDLSGLSLDQENSNQVSISSGYSKTKHGRSIRRH